MSNKRKGPSAAPQYSGSGISSNSSHGALTFGAGGNQIGAVYGNVNLGMTGEHDAPTEVPPEPTTASLRIGPIEEKEVAHRPGDRFSIDITGTKSAVLWICNDRKSSGKVEIGVSLIFTARGQVEAHINRAFWIGYSGYRLTLDVAEREAVLLGQFHRGNWETFACKREFPVNYRTAGEMRRSLQLPLTKPDRFNFVEDVHVDVAVIDLLSGKEIASAAYLMSTSETSQAAFVWEVA